MSELKTKIVIEAQDRFSGVFAKTEQALGRVRQTQKSVQAFRALKRQSIQTAAQLQTLQGRSRALAAQMARTGPSKKLKRALEQNNKAARRLKKTHHEQQVNLQRLRGALRQAGVQTQNLAAHQRRLSVEAERLSRRLERQKRAWHGVSRVGQALRRMAKLAGGAAAGVTALGYGVSRAMGPLVRTAAEFERYRIQLEALEGSSARAESAMAWVSQFARQTPFELAGVMQAFVKLRAFGMDPMDGSLQAIADQTAKLGGGQQELEGIILALGQAWTKQKLQGEEILQLMERSVPVFDLLEKATGRSAAELRNLSSEGRLGRKAIQLLMQEMGKQSAGQAQAQMQSFNGQLANLGDSWMRIKLMIMQAGPFDFLKQQMAEVAGWLERLQQSGELAANMRQIGSALNQGLKFAFAILGGIYRMVKGIGTVIGAVVQAVWTLSLPLRMVFDLIGGAINKVIGLIDTLTGAGIGNWIGRVVSATLAAFGNDQAEYAIQTELNQTLNDLAPPVAEPSGRSRRGRRHRAPGLVAEAPGLPGAKPLGLRSRRGSTPDIPVGRRRTRGRTARALITDQPAPAPAMAQVGGTLHIKIDAEGRPSIRKLEKQGEMDIDVATGPIMVMP